MFKDKDKDKKLGDSEYRDPESIYPNSITPRMWLDGSGIQYAKVNFNSCSRFIWTERFISEYVASILFYV